MADNMFTPRLIDIVIPMKKSPHSSTTEKFDDLFLVMECVDMNLNGTLGKLKANSFQE